MSINAKIDKGEFSHYFQPIYNLSNWEVEGYEVLLNSTSDSFLAHVFKNAEQEDVLYELDISSIYNAVYHYNTAAFDKRFGKLHINVFLSTILNPAFPSFLRFLKTSFPDMKDTVFEINKSKDIANIIKAAEINDIIRELGFKIGLDHLGRTNTGIKELIEVEPDVIKLDGYFSEGLEQSEKKQTAVGLFNKYCTDHDTKLVLAGIETPAALAIAKYLGIPFGQGHLLAKPQPLEHSYNWTELPLDEQQHLHSFYRKIQCN